MTSDEPVRAEVERLREELGGLRLIHATCMDDTAWVEREKRLRAEVARCDEELRRLGAQWAERNEALRAEVERLRKQARCGHSPWPCNCGYSGGMCD